MNAELMSRVCESARACVVNEQPSMYMFPLEISPKELSYSPASSGAVVVQQG